MEKTEAPKEEKDFNFWKWLPSFGNSNCEEFNRKLKEQRFSVQKMMKNFPNLKEIKSNPQKYSLQKVKEEMTKERMILPSSENDDLVKSFN